MQPGRAASALLHPILQHLQVNAVAGDSRLGGADFDARVAAHLAHVYETTHGRQLGSDARALHRLRKAAEAARRQLTSAASAAVELEGVQGDAGLSCSLSRARFEELCADLFERCAARVDQVSLGCKQAAQAAFGLLVASMHVRTSRASCRACLWLPWPRCCARLAWRAGRWTRCCCRAAPPACRACRSCCARASAPPRTSPSATRPRWHAGRRCRCGRAARVQPSASALLALVTALSAHMVAWLLRMAVHCVLGAQEPHPSPPAGAMPPLAGRHPGWCGGRGAGRHPDAGGRAAHAGLCRRRRHPGGCGATQHRGPHHEGARPAPGPGAGRGAGGLRGPGGPGWGNANRSRQAAQFSGRSCANAPGVWGGKREARSCDGGTSRSPVCAASHALKTGRFGRATAAPRNRVRSAPCSAAQVYEQAGVEAVVAGSVLVGRFACPAGPQELLTHTICLDLDANRELHLPCTPGGACQPARM